MNRRQFSLLRNPLLLGAILLLLTPAPLHPLSPAPPLPLPLLPDSEIVFSPSAIGFDVTVYVARAGGYLSSYQQYLNSTGWTSGAEIVARVALENSINPRLLLSLLEYRCGCVLADPEKEVDGDYLMGVMDPRRKGFYQQLGWIVNQLSIGYYGWRSGSLTQISFADGSVFTTSPDSNAGSVALQYLFAQLYDHDGWQRALDPNEGFVALHRRMFGDPTERARPLMSPLPDVLIQPTFILPFEPGQLWSYTSGPHRAWETEGALAALDFAPASEKSGCVPSQAWAVAVVAGLVVRAGNGAVVLDLDGDSWEQTGWAVLYMHIESRERVAVGSYLRAGDPIGHPSCEGGPASGTHVHIARKYNGEWVAADGPVPFVMDGWTAHAGARPFEGTLVRNGKTITANPYGSRQTFIVREVFSPAPCHWGKVNPWQ